MYKLDPCENIEMTRAGSLTAKGTLLRKTNDKQIITALRKKLS